MKVSARAAFTPGFFLAFLIFFLSSNLHAQPYPPLPPPPEAAASAEAAPSNSPYRNRPAYPGMAPGLVAQLPGQPKDLSGRFGLGVTNLGPKLSPVLSLDWQTSRSTSLEFDLGFDTLHNNSEIVIFSRFSRNMFIEESLHFFLYLGGGLSSQRDEGRSESGLLLDGGAGVRVFLPGLPNLAWHLRYGLFFDGGGSDRLFTTGFTGVHYYF